MPIGIAGHFVSRNPKAIAGLEFPLNNRDKIWELLFLKLNPTNPLTNPNEVVVYMTLNPKQVHTVPETPIQRILQYTVEGKESLTDPDWTTLGKLGDTLPENYRFFRVIGE